MKKFAFTAALVLLGTWVFAQEKIAVFPFEDMEKVLTRNEAVMFYREFSNEFTNRSAGKFTVVPRQEIEKLINTEAAFQLSDFSAKAKTAEMQRVLNGTQILSGLIGKLGSNIRITVSLYTYPELQQLPGGTTLSVANTRELFDKIPELVWRMQDEITGGSRDQPVPEGLLYEIVDGKTVTITKYSGNAVALTIPSHIEGLLVTVIGFTAFYDCSSLTSITIPSSVISIKETAVYDCSSLTSITVDNRNPSYTSVDGILFDKNIQTLIRYPQGRNQETYVIPSSITSIGNYSFSNCDNLSNITIPSSVRSIGDYAFTSCDSLTSVIIPSSVTSLSRNAFSSCRKLTSINVDNRNSVYASIDGVLFDKSIRTLISYPKARNQRIYVIPSSVMSIGDLAFDSSSLTTITIPSSVTSIGDRVFSFCSNLTTITIPSSVTSIGGSVFMGSKNLDSINVDNRNSVYASIDGVLFDKNIRNLIQYPEGKNQGTYVIPSSVTHIGIGAFGDSTLASITLPSSITSIGFAAFDNCRGLTSITIPSSVTHIEDSAFTRCYNLISVTISRRTQVGENAFPASARITYRD